MPMFGGIVRETRVVDCRYAVEAPDQETANEMLKNGETVMEFDLKGTVEVLNRQIIESAVQSET